jgi:hypothetical protein
MYSIYSGCNYRLFITSIMHQQLWRYKVEEKIYLGVRKRKRSNITAVTDRHSQYSPVTDTHSQYSPVIDRHSQYSPVTDRHSQYSPVTDRHSQYSPVTDRHSQYSPVTDRHSQFSRNKMCDTAVMFTCSLETRCVTLQ